MKTLSKVWSFIVQAFAIIFIIYFTFKSEITPKDVISMLFWCTMYLVEEIRQIKWFLKESEDEEILNKNK